MNNLQPDDLAEVSDVITGIMAEFSEAYSLSRSRWARFAAEVHPDLSGASMIILQLILREGPVIATDISQLLDIDKSFISRQISKLRELGYVVATEAPDDRRVQLLTTTEKAAKLINHFSEMWVHTYHERFKGWSAAELQALHDGLRRFNCASKA
ncbi:MAG TPA: MarR family transcriptional regulator [Microbacteriaceae bacterium]|nr:MarR family transcriptional regulator [Microbacteriaceae bacterium]